MLMVAMCSLPEQQRSAGEARLPFMDRKAWVQLTYNNQIFSIPGRD